jgi:hypothetical protein
MMILLLEEVVPLLAKIVHLLQGGAPAGRVVPRPVRRQNGSPA